MKVGEAAALAAACLAFIAVLAATFGGARPPAPTFARLAPAESDARTTTNLPARAGDSVAQVGQPRSFGAVQTPSAFECKDPVVVDGDTLRCGPVRVRLASIDSPELPGHCRRGRACTPGDPQASRENLRRLVGEGPMTCRQTDLDRYGRVVALCSAAGSDLSCAQVAAGHAIERYGRLTC